MRVSVKTLTLVGINPLKLYFYPIQLSNTQYPIHGTNVVFTINCFLKEFVRLFKCFQTNRNSYQSN